MLFRLDDVHIVFNCGIRPRPNSESIPIERMLMPKPTRRTKHTADSGRTMLVRQMLTMIDQAYNRKAWHGTNFRGSLRRVSAEQAAWRPGSDRHNIWEIVVHVAYYKYVLWRRITGEKRGAFPYSAEKTWGDWFTRPDHISERAWKDDLALLKEYHDKLRDVIADLDLSMDSKAWSKIEYRVIGAAYHDIYHAGQIQLLKRMYGARKR